MDPAGSSLNSAPPGAEVGHGLRVGAGWAGGTGPVQPGLWAVVPRRRSFKRPSRAWSDPVPEEAAELR